MVRKCAICGASSSTPAPWRGHESTTCGPVAGVNPDDADLVGRFLASAFPDATVGVRVSAQSKVERLPLTSPRVDISKMSLCAFHTPRRTLALAELRRTIANDHASAAAISRVERAERSAMAEDIAAASHLRMNKGALSADLDGLGEDIADGAAVAAASAAAAAASLAGSGSSEPVGPDGINLFPGLALAGPPMKYVAPYLLRSDRAHVADQKNFRLVTPDPAAPSSRVLDFSMVAAVFEAGVSEDKKLTWHVLSCGDADIKHGEPFIGASSPWGFWPWTKEVGLAKVFPDLVSKTKRFSKHFASRSGPGTTIDVRTHVSVGAGAPTRFPWLTSQGLLALAFAVQQDAMTALGRARSGEAAKKPKQSRVVRPASGAPMMDPDVVATGPPAPAHSMPVAAAARVPAPGLTVDTHAATGMRAGAGVGFDSSVSALAGAAAPPIEQAPAAPSPNSAATAARNIAAAERQLLCATAFVRAVMTKLTRQPPAPVAVPTTATATATGGLDLSAAFPAPTVSLSPAVSSAMVVAPADPTSSSVAHLSNPAAVKRLRAAQAMPPAKRPHTEAT